jgi:hypothetical protein
MRVADGEQAALRGPDSAGKRSPPRGLGDQARCQRDIVGAITGNQLRNAEQRQHARALPAAHVRPGQRDDRQPAG